MLPCDDDVMMRSVTNNMHLLLNKVSSVMDISMSQRWNRLDESKDRLTEHRIFSVCIRVRYY